MQVFGEIMRLTSYKVEGATRLGLVLNEMVFDLNKAYTSLFGERRVFPNDMISLLEGGERIFLKVRELHEALTEHDEPSKQKGICHILRDVKILAPIPRPRKNIVCLGVNYPDHAAETKHEPPRYPIFFTKAPTCVIGVGDPIVLPKCSQRIDYEVELAFILGRKGKNIKEEEAWDYIAGYAVLNDVTARDLQRSHQQWFKGKSLDTFAPMGPCLVTPDEVDDPHNLNLRLSLNGKVMQEDNTKELFFKIPEILASLSVDMTVEAGDIVATGTPGGIGDSRSPPVYLKPGDCVRSEVEGIGVLENPVTSAAEES